jgi:hypothetical protein
MKHSILARIARLEAQMLISVQEEEPKYDTSRLSVEQRERVRDAARLLMEARNGRIQLTDEHQHVIHEAWNIMETCRVERASNHQSIH